MGFFRNVKNYYEYIKLTSISELKAQVAESYLGWLWWILDPLLFMFVYSFVVTMVFGTSVDNFPLFVFIGLIAWNYFSSSVGEAVGVIRSYRSVLLKTNMPKYLFLIVRLMVNFVKFLIGFAIILAVVLILNINISLHLFTAIPIIIVYTVVTFGVSLIFAHFGVYVADLKNVTTVLLRLLFYLSGIFYTIERLPEAVKNIYIYICPTGFIIGELRNAMMFGESLNYIVLGYWLVIGIVLCILGLRLFAKYEKEYVKVV